jgi:hypothetical protein
MPGWPWATSPRFGELTILGWTTGLLIIVRHRSRAGVWLERCAWIGQCGTDQARPPNPAHLAETEHQSLGRGGDQGAGGWRLTCWVYRLAAVRCWVKDCLPPRHRADPGPARRCLRCLASGPGGVCCSGREDSPRRRVVQLGPVRRFGTDSASAPNPACWLAVEH